MPTGVKKELIEVAMNLLQIKSNMNDLTQETLTRNYRRLALEFHPDKAAAEHKDTAEQAMKEINTANDLLKGFLSGEIVIGVDEAHPTATATRETSPSPKASAPDEPKMGLVEASVFVGVGVAAVASSPAFAAVIYLTAVSISAAPAVLIMLHIRSHLLFKRPYEFGDLFLNDACEKVKEYQFGDLVLKRAGRAITGNPEYKVGDILSAGIGMFSRCKAAEATPKLDAEKGQEVNNGVEPNARP